MLLNRLQETVPDFHSFLLDPSFFSSFLPLEKKPFFFLLCAEQSVFAGLPVVRGVGEEQQATAVGGPTGAGSCSELGFVNLG